MYDIDKMKHDLKSKLSDFRYNHCMMVAKEAEKLAIYYNQNSEKAYVAGLLHDIAKEFTDEENQYWIQKYKLPSSLLLDNLKPVIHADIGAVVVRDLYNLDEEICNSIKYHAIGNYPMTMFEKIIFVADKIARDTTDDAILKMQKLAYGQIDAVLKMCLEYSKNKLENHGSHLEPVTERLLNSLS